jgi:hypothetical protein
MEKRFSPRILYQKWGIIKSKAIKSHEQSCFEKESKLFLVTPGETSKQCDGELL